MAVAVAGTEGDRAAIVRFWSAVEMFSPPSVENVNRQRHVYALSPDEPLPWEPDHELAGVRLRRGRAWRHVVYVGAYSLESVYEVLAQVFGSDEQSFDERQAASSALAAFVVSGTGHPVPDSQTLSCCAWATGRAVRPGPGTPGWLDGFDGAENNFGAEFNRLIYPFVVQASDRRDKLGRPTRPPLDLKTLLACRDAAAEAAGASALFPHAEIRVSSTEVPSRGAGDANPPAGTGGTETHDFLNSFVVGDLRQVAQRTAHEPVGVALREYLRPNADVNVGARIDIRERIDVVLETTAPAHVPLGRWPSKPEHALATSQQLAVDGVMRMMAAESGIFAVNGPPGTGKTTMLRDIVAAVVVERARRLAELASPRDAFTGRHHWQTGERTRVVHAWKPQLTGFEMVVASANNGAVQNVTDEIPGRGAVADCWQAEATRLAYFPDLASALLTNDETAAQPDPGSEPASAAWALVAARLGNKLNRNRFVGDFWYDRQVPQPQVKGGTGGWPAHEGRTDKRRAATLVTRPGLMSVLKGFEATTPPASWLSAVAKFRRALDAATALQATRNQAFGILARQAQTELEARAASAAANHSRRELAELQARRTQVSATVTAWQAERERRVTVRVEHHRFRPGLVETLTSRATSKAWRRRDDELAAEVAAAERALTAAGAEVETLAGEVERANSTFAYHDGEVRRLKHELGTVVHRLDQARAELGSWVPDASWRDDRVRRETAAPWTDPVWNQARTELFFAALHLHKAFLRHVPREMRQSLQAAMDVVSGAVPRDVPAAVVLEAWRALFFVVPVVSTTFASFGRLFSHLGKESLGWLLIDESGQASPQVAVGALWRSRRAVVVGDPLQLEPVSTLPFRVEQVLRRDHGVDEQWLPSRTSVQRLADRLNPLGTWLPDDDGKIWVGAPLTVHRRCDEPMFGVVNDVVYDGLMIDGKSPEDSAAFTSAHPMLPESKWIDVVSAEAQGNWVPAEGLVLERILAALATRKFDMSEVMVIAPFRDIARHVQPYVLRYRGLVAGTVHTAQGKQADIVILVLGGDPSRPGAKRWAASKPNLLNVAVSRAKRRVYVIGDRKAWAVQRYFDVLARRLPHSPPR